MLLVLGSSVGCTDEVHGSMRPAPGLVPRPLLGPGVRQMLLDSAELSRTFGQQFIVDPNQPSRSGGAELMLGNAMVPPQCAGVATMLISDGYAGSDVRNIALDNWLYTGLNPTAIMVHEAVVALTTATAATARFAALKQQWAGCDGATMTIGGDANFTFRVGHVEDKDSVLTAPVDQISSYVTLPIGRAVGVRVNCIVEIEVIYYGSQDRDGSGHHAPSAADTARLIMDKISAQS